METSTKKFLNKESTQSNSTILQKTFFKNLREKVRLKISVKTYIS